MCLACALGVMWLRKAVRRHAALVIFLASYIGGVGAAIAGFAEHARYVALPALFLSGWTVLGLLVTLDDDLPGGWSNPEKSQSIWRHSLVVLGASVLVLTLLVVSVYV